MLCIFLQSIVLTGILMRSIFYWARDVRVEALMKFL